MMPFDTEKNPQQERMGPLLSKSLRNMIRHKFITEYGYSDSIPLAEFIADDLMALIDSVLKDKALIKPGQLLWIAVDKNHHHHGYGRSLADIPMKPVVLTFLTEDDIIKYITTKGRKQKIRLLIQRIARMLNEAYEQAGPLAQSDLAAFFSLSCARISQYFKQWQQEHGEILPYRGSVHDCGPTLTHKVQAIERILAGEALSDVARALNHSLPDIERYYKAYNQVETAASFCDDVEKIALMCNISLSLVKEYYALVEKFAPHSMLKNQRKPFDAKSVSD